MGKGLPRSHSRGDPQKQEIIKQVFTVNALALTVDGASGVGFGTVVIGDFPEGNILLLGAVAYMALSGPGGDAGLVDTWVGDFGIGTIPTADGDLGDLGDDDIIPSTALAAATAEVGPRTRGVSTATESGVVFDNTDNSLEMNLNVLVDDNDISADGIAFIATGELHVAYIMLGDD